MNTSRIVMSVTAAVLVSGALSGLGPVGVTAHARPGAPAPTDDNGWGPAHHWCPGEEPRPATGNHVTDPLIWDWNVCHTYYFLWPGMGNVSSLIWDGDNPPPRPGTPPGLYCDPETFRNCRIDTHP
ncbi:hypothetical protein [Mycobacterium sp.]|uniref:hypothetical protein n=1 Tax=Mycobacterium sp. TaxID=1785 RepID=UPI0025F854AB|nr:hypothetical protein [Mycobacterium sp.]